MKLSCYSVLIRQFVFWFSSFVLSSAVLKAEDAKPMLVITDDSNQGVGSVLYWDCPVFAAYSNGVVIWRKNWASSVDAFRMSVGNKGDPVVKKLVQSVADYGGKTFALTTSSDPDETTITCNQEVVKVRGNWRKRSHFEKETLRPSQENVVACGEDEKLQTIFPASIREALAEIAEFDDAEAKPWRPEKLEIILYPAGPALRDQVSWPEDWPHSFSFLPGSEMSKSIELPGDMLDKVLNLVAREGRPRAVILDGEKMFARIRFKFPGE